MSENAIHEVKEWLCAEAHHRNLDARFYTEAAETVAKGWLILPAFIEGDLDAFVFASGLQELEDSWNDREPKPALRLVLRPAAR